MTMRFGLVALSAIFPLLVVTHSGTDTDPLKSVALQPQPIVNEAFVEEAEAPLLMAGNTACNPRVTVCEE
ncbi:hypothetical protein ACUNV4_22835 [Granulosicoccus sp. 3-233]|uniref:hypothetical protein n=1 Tax=Granulosicoccus sp. 3-233 TaxID=3417969 RepID=UPI003D3255F8